MTSVELMSAVLLDGVIGDPRWLPHPVRIMGRAVSWCDDHIRIICHAPWSLRVGGVCLALLIPTVTFFAGRLLIEQAGRLSDPLGHAASIVLAFTTLAGRDLLDHVRAIRRELRSGNLPKARQAVAKIVGRDTETLPEPEIIRATVETIAESACDGLIAPLVYLTLGGAPLALAYKAVNTLDSMIGHRDERYVHVGWASARFDDVANWIPARITAALVAAAAGLVTGQAQRTVESLRVCRRDGAKHPSPNSGRPEAAMAGAMDVQLGGVNYYEGRREERPVIGDGTRTLERRDIDSAGRILVVGYGLGCLLALAVLWMS